MEKSFRTTASEPVYIFKAKLKYDKRTWRKIEIPAHMTLDDLAGAIIDSFKFDYDHLYSFFMSNKAWDENSEYAHPEGLSEPITELKGRRIITKPSRPHADKVKLSSLNFELKQKFLFLYDYGDNWEFEIELVAFADSCKKSSKYPQVTEVHGKAPRQYCNS
jgi:hypothetical protein